MELSVANVTGVNIPLVRTTMRGLQFTGNSCNLWSNSGTTCVKVPATLNKLINAAIIGNNLGGSALGTPFQRVVNWNPAMGTRSANGPIEPDEETFEVWRPELAEAEVRSDRVEWHPPGAPEAFALDLPSFFGPVPK